MRQAWVAFGATVAGAALAAFALYRYALSYPDRACERPGRAVTVVIPRGVNFPRIVDLLAERGVIGNRVAFRFYANYKGVASRVRAGAYPLRTSITPRELLHTLVHGVAAPQLTVVIPEGKNIFEVAELLEQAGAAPAKDLLREMRNPVFLRRIGVPGASLEGYLFPETYKLRAATAPQKVLELLFAQHKKVFHALCAKHPAGLKRLRQRHRWGHAEIATLASVIEKETARAAERPLIAGVFLNRLAGLLPSRKLQSDPTIVYGCVAPATKSAACQRFEGRIRRIHLDDEQNPYNTYTHAGLPPGPIANPGRAALEAVLAPAKTRYLYFVSRNDGSHYFSRTQAEHERAVDFYQRGRGVAPPPSP
jgi:UPF0755 protein